MPPTDDILDELFAVIASRREGSPESSYTARLMHAGPAKINEKIREEADEFCQAALEDDDEHFVYEACDLLYHSFVQCGLRGVTLEDLRAELRRRFGTSGLDEKAQRTSP